MIKVIYGLKGSGKTLYAISYIRRHSSDYAGIYTNINVDLSIGDNVYFLNTNPLSYYNGRKVVHSFDFENASFPPNSLIVIDESALVFNNREYDSFPAAIRSLLVNERRYKLDFIFICQNPQMIDITILRLADEHILCNNKWSWYDLLLKWIGFLKREHYYTELSVQSLDDWTGDNSQVKVTLVKDKKNGYMYKRKYFRFYNTFADDPREPYPQNRDFSQGI